VLQRPGHLQAGGAAVEDHGLPVGDQPGDLGGDAPLGLQSLRRPQPEGRFVAAQQQTPRSSAVPLNALTMR